MTYQELKSIVSIADVASYLGYQFDRSKGLSQPSFVLKSGNEEIDRIYIKNPHNNNIQGYWRRGDNKGGDVISFVSENISKFSETGYNKLDKINKVLHKFANQSYEFKPSEYKTIPQKKQSFDKDRWQIINNPFDRDKYLQSRGINSNTGIIFKEHIKIVHDNQSKYNYNNIAFPYSIPGKDETVGYEIRGYNGFKSKATGTNSQQGMWLAKFNENPSDIKNIFISESALDALSFFELYQGRIKLDQSVFVSFGGSFSDEQYKGLIKHYPNAKPILLFDNDLNGHMYDIRALCLSLDIQMKAKLDNKSNIITFSLDRVSTNKQQTFSIEADKLSLNTFLTESNLRINNNELAVMKPNNGHKDWNELLFQEQKSNTVSKYAIK